MHLSDELFLALVSILFVIPLLQSTVPFRGKLSFAISVVLWLGALTVLSMSGLLDDFSAMPPRMAVVFLPPFIFAILITWSMRFLPWRQGLPVHFLIGLQSFRIVMEIILWMLYHERRIPVQMTFEGRNFDILAGLTAPVVAYLYKTGKIGRSLAIVWNIGGLLLLVNIVGTAILSMPTPFRLFENEPANTIVAHWPFIWLPGFVVPVAYTAHFFCLKRLMQDKHSSRT